jgi:hypothetical protein
MNGNTLIFNTNDNVQFETPKEIIRMFKYILDRQDRNIISLKI